MLVKSKFTYIVFFLLFVAIFTLGNTDYREKEALSFRTQVDLRGLSVTKKHIIIGAWNERTVYVYNKRNKLVQQINGSTKFFGHGITANDEYVWTSDYLGRTIYQYEIETGNLIKKWKFTSGKPVRMDLDEVSNTLYITCYKKQEVFNYSLDGELLSKFKIEPFEDNPAICVYNQHIYIHPCIAQPKNPRFIYKYSMTGELLKKVKFTKGLWAIDMYKGKLYFDSNAKKIFRIKMDLNLL